MLTFLALRQPTSSNPSVRLFLAIQTLLKKYSRSMKNAAKTPASAKPAKSLKTPAQIDKSPKTLHRVHSSLVLDGPDRAASRAMLYPVGFSTADFKKSLIGIASTW